jgi:hypothetical protein
LKQSRRVQIGEFEFSLDRRDEEIKKYRAAAAEAIKAGGTVPKPVLVNIFNMPEEMRPK